MSESFVGEIRMFGGNFAPRGWAFCEGQLLAISSNDALFSLFGTTYGGDGRTTFALPDLRGRIPVHAGGSTAGPGLTRRVLGARSGSETVTLTTSQIPAHDHAMRASTDDASNAVGPDNSVTGDAGDTLLYAALPGPPVAMSAASVANSGGGQSHNNMAPALAVSFIVALVGIYPSRN